jgi:hypothetical protein
MMSSSAHVRNGSKADVVPITRGGNFVPFGRSASMVVTRSERVVGAVMLVGSLTLLGFHLSGRIPENFPAVPLMMAVAAAWSVFVKRVLERDQERGPDRA